MSNDMSDMDADTQGFAIDDLLKRTISKESQTTRVESVIQDADSLSTVAGSSATARFTLPPKGQILAPNGRLIFKLTWENFNAGTDRMLSVPRFGGACSVIQECRLFCGALIERNTLAGHKINIENNALPYDAQNEVLDELIGSNHGYSYDSDGTIALTADIANGSAGTRAITDDANGTVEFSIPIDSMFSCLKDIMIPTFLKNPIIIEVDFNLTRGDVVVSSGAGAAATGNINVSRPRLDLDYLVIEEQMAEAFRETVMGTTGQAVAFRNNVAIQKTIPATPNSTTQEVDLEIGLARQRVMKIFIEKQLTYDNPLLKNMRSDGLLGEELQMFVNNQNMFDRKVDRLSDFYVYLGQCVGTSYKVLNGSYELVGDLAANNLMNDNTTLPSSAGGDGSFALVKENLQGRLRWLGVNMGQARMDGHDNPNNSLLIGDSPIVIRLTRTVPAAAPAKTPRGETNSVSAISACNVNVFAEVVKVMSIQNGEIQVMAG